MARQHKKTSFSLANPPDFQPELGRRKISSVLFSLRGSSYAKKKSGARSKSSQGRYQRVVVKARVVKMNRGLASLRAHVRYLKRSGTGLEKKEPNLTSEFGEVSELVKSWQGDPHHFRFIISPERGADLNLEEYKNRVLGELEKELGRDLEWFSVAHYNTDNPHCHVVIRGRDRAGEVLLIPKETIKNTFREICQKEATKELGLSFEERKFGGLEREGFASIDWVLLSKMKETGRVCVYELKGIEFKTAALKRLDFLSQYGLAEERHTGEWFLSPETEKTLRTLEKKNQLRTTIEKEFGVVAGDFVDLREKLPGQNGIFGKVLGVSILDELSGEKLALVQAADGINYVERLREEDELRAGSIVRLWKRELGAADKVIQRYSSDGALNLSQLRSDAEDWKVPPGLTFESYFSRFEQRVETLVRAGILKDLGGNRFSAPQDLADEIHKHFGEKERRTEFEEIYRGDLKKLVTSQGITFLEQLQGGVSSERFGGELIWLKTEREKELLARGIDGNTPEGKQRLYRRLEQDIEKHFSPLRLESAQSKRRYSGKVISHVKTAIGQKLAVSSGNSLHLLTPYRRGLVPEVGQEVSFEIKSENEHGVPVQRLNNINLERSRER